MFSNRGSLSPWAARVVIAGFALLLSLGLAGLGVLLSNTYGAAQVARNARQLHWANATLGASGIARAAVAQGVFFSYEDVSDRAGTRRAIEEAEANLDAVSELADSVQAPESASLTSLIETFVASGKEAMALAAAGQSTDAEALRLTAVEPSYEDLRADLNQRQTDLAQLVTDTEREAGRISRITFVAISFFIPAVSMIVFWLVLRRRVKRREQELQGLIDLNRAKDEFIGGLSHELRTPLTSIVGFSELLLENPTIDEDAREQLTLIHASSSDLTRMVEDLLVAARIDADALSVNPTVLRLDLEVATAVSSYALSGEDIEVKVPPIEVYADALHVRQIVHNLVSNAVRHGGERILVSASERGTSTLLIVADDGPGVSPDVERKLFKRFVHEGRRALVAGSVGLGLAISQELARRMGGVLRYRRTDGWTTFTLSIPTLPSRSPADSPETVGSRVAVDL